MCSSSFQHLWLQDLLQLSRPVFLAGRPATHSQLSHIPALAAEAGTCVHHPCHPGGWCVARARRQGKDGQGIVLVPQGLAVSLGDPGTSPSRSAGQNMNVCSSSATETRMPHLFLFLHAEFTGIFFVACIPNGAWHVPSRVETISTAESC